MTEKRVMLGVAVTLALAALVGCQNSKDFEIRAGVLIKYVGAGAKVKIPSSVTTIGAQAFARLGITSVSIPSSVTKIEYEAFAFCTGLTGVTIPNSVTEIGDLAFMDCTGLTSVTIPNGVTVSGDRTTGVVDGIIHGVHSSSFDGDFANVYNGNGKQAGTYVRNGNTWTKQGSAVSKTAGSNEGFDIQNGVLVKYTGTAEKITIPSNVTEIGGNAFKDCTSLTSVNIPKSVTSIGDAAFWGCTGLTSVSIPKSVTSIGDAAFWRCTGLTGVSIPKSVTSIGRSAFFGCTGLTGVSIPNSVTSIGDTAFRECTSLTSVSIPKSVTSIGAAAFSGCAGLVKITVSSGNSAYTSIGGVLFNKAATTLVQVPPSRKGSSYTVPKNVTSIGRGAFYGCIGLTGIIIPDGVTVIEEWAFVGCTGLVKITVASGNSGYTSIDGVLFNAGATKLICYPAGKQGSIYSIPGGVTEIEEAAFYGLTGLTSITIPNSVTVIGNAAFRECTGLTGITIPASITSIGNWAFYGCTGLASITIPASLTSIGGYVFYGCTGLTSVTIPASVARIINDYSVLGDELFDIYNGNGKQAGTYVKNGDTWRKR